MMHELNQHGLPKWFIRSYLFGSGSESVDKKRWRIQVVGAIVWLTLLTISTMSTTGTILRLLVSFGYDMLGEFGHRAGNLSNGSMNMQLLISQLIQLKYFASENLASQRLLQPLRSEETTKRLDKVLKAYSITIFVISAGFPAYFSYIIYGNNWYILIYRTTVGLLFAYNCQATLSLLICNGLFLNRTCQHLRDQISILHDQLRLDHRGKSRKIAITTICTQFQTICVELNKHNQYWKRLIFVIVCTEMPMAVNASFVVLKIESKLMDVLGIAVIVAMLGGASLFYLSPAKVELKLRKCYPLMCQLLRYRSINWTLKLKLLRLVQQFDNLISFTSWDTNKLDYMDCIEVCVFAK